MNAKPIATPGKALLSCSPVPSGKGLGDPADYRVSIKSKSGDLFAARCSVEGHNLGRLLAS